MPVPAGKTNQQMEKAWEPEGATAAVVIGFVIMLFLDVTLGG